MSTQGARRLRHLHEQVARRLINIEEHDYSLASDAEPCAARTQSLRISPQIVTIRAVIRRLRYPRAPTSALQPTVRRARVAAACAPRNHFNNVRSALKGAFCKFDETHYRKGGGQYSSAFKPKPSRIT